MGLESMKCPSGYRVSTEPHLYTLTHTNAHTHSLRALGELPDTQSADMHCPSGWLVTRNQSHSTSRPKGTHGVSLEGRRAGSQAPVWRQGGPGENKVQGRHLGLGYSQEV